MWVTAGKEHQAEPGFYGFGEMTDPEVYEGVGGGEYWTADDDEAANQRFYVDVLIKPLEQPILKSDLLELGIGFEAIEPIKAARRANPMVLHAELFDSLKEHFSLATLEPSEEQREATLVDKLERASVIEVFDGEDIAFFVVETESDDGSSAFMLLAEATDAWPELPGSMTYSDLTQLVGVFRFQLDAIGTAAETAAAPLTTGSVLDNFFAMVTRPEPLVLLRTGIDEFVVAEMPVEHTGENVPILASGSTPTEALWAALDINESAESAH